MGELLGINVVQGGAGAIVALVVVMILTGRLVPRRVLEDERAGADARRQELVRERDTWRDTALTEASARRAAQDQVGELLELSRTAGHLMAAIAHPPATRREVAADDAVVDQVPAPPT